MWKEELEKMSVRIIHSTAYNPQSTGLLERAVRALKELLKKNTNLSQSHLSEDKGPAMTRFIGRGTKSNLPNSSDRSVDWRQQRDMRGEEKEKRVRKK